MPKLTDEQRRERRELADQILNLRRELHLSRYRMGLLAGVSPSRVQSCEFGIANEEVALRVLKALQNAVTALSLRER